MLEAWLRPHLPNLLAGIMCGKVARCSAFTPKCMTSDSTKFEVLLGVVTLVFSLLSPLQCGASVGGVSPGSCQNSRQGGGARRGEWGWLSWCHQSQQRRRRRQRWWWQQRRQCCGCRRGGGQLAPGVPPGGPAPQGPGPQLFLYRHWPPLTAHILLQSAASTTPQDVQRHRYPSVFLLLHTYF